MDKEAVLLILERGFGTKPIDSIHVRGRKDWTIGNSFVEVSDDVLVIRPKEVNQENIAQLNCLRLARISSLRCSPYTKDGVPTIGKYSIDITFSYGGESFDVSYVTAGLLDIPDMEVLSAPAKKYRNSCVMLLASCIDALEKGKSEMDIQAVAKYNSTLMLWFSHDKDFLKKTIIPMDKSVTWDGVKSVLSKLSDWATIVKRAIYIHEMQNCLSLIELNKTQEVSQTID